MHEGSTGAGLRPRTAAVEEVVWRRRRKCRGTRVGVFFNFSCKKEQLIIEVITLLEYVNNF
jgi:hypothetical protein